MDDSKHPRVISYINVKLISLRFLLRKDILNHCDINIISFFNYSIICLILNIYSDDHQNTLKYLKNTKVNLNNILIIIEDFNIRDNDWDSSYHYYSLYTDILREVTDIFGLELLTHINLVSRQYIDNFQELNSDLNLIFLILIPQNKVKRVKQSLSELQTLDYILFSFYFHFYFYS